MVGGWWLLASSESVISIKSTSLQAGPRNQREKREK